MCVCVCVCVCVYVCVCARACVEMRVSVDTCSLEKRGGLLARGARAKDAPIRHDMPTYPPITAGIEAEEVQEIEREFNADFLRNMIVSPCRSPVFRRRCPD